MTQRKPFLLRLDASIYSALEKWAADDLRSLNAQIEYLLRENLRKAGRMPRPAETPSENPPPATA